MQMDAGFRKQILGLDLATFATAFAKSLHGDKTLLTEDEMRTVLANAHEEYRKKQASLREEKAQATLKEGEKFLAENKNKEDMLTFHRRHIDVRAHFDYDEAPSFCHRLLDRRNNLIGRADRQDVGQPRAEPLI
jgi:Domain amino terminal to FKBP-type peptidyl-prolyl isomerase